MRTSIILILILLISSSCKKKKKEYTPQETPIEQAVKWEVYNQSNSRLINNQVNTIAIDKNDIKWVGTSNGLVRINENDWKNFTKINSDLPSATIQALATQDNGTIWIGTDAGLVKFDGTNWIVYNKQNSKLVDDGIMSLCYDNLNKKVWVGTAKGLLSIDEIGKQELFDVFDGDLILSLATDRNGAVWMGCFDPFQFNGKIIKFQNNNLITYRLDVLGYTSSFPYSLAVDQNNNVIVTLSGTSVNAVIRFNGSTWAEITQTQSIFGIKAVAIDKNRIWIGGGKSLTAFTDKQSPLFTIPNAKSFILCMALDGKGKKWIGTTSDGLISLSN
jgi:ligand-binding sensor domain-containing protein